MNEPFYRSVARTTPTHPARPGARPPARLPSRCLERDRDGQYPYPEGATTHRTPAVAVTVALSHRSRLRHIGD